MDCLPPPAEGGFDVKVYELMKALADMPAGAEVVFHRLLEIKEVPVYDGTIRMAKFVIRSAELDDTMGKVLLDGWAE